MRTKMIQGVLILLAIAFLGWQTGIAQAQDQPPPPKEKVRGQDATPLQKPEPPPEREPKLADVYAQLRALSSRYQEARSEEDRQNILLQGENLLSRIFDAKMDREQNYLQAEERRLNARRELLQRKQSQKREWVHSAVQRFFDTGEVPELEIGQEP